MPPVSVTMQPRNLLAVVAAVLLPELLGDDDDGELAEPHPAASRVAPATATVIIDLLNSYLLDEGSAMLPQRPPASLATPAGRGHMTPPYGIARRLALPAKARKELADLLVMLMPN
ncbi:MAG: hypothetical protein ACLQFR_24755 [Streptosporangiaceae bacterium]